MTYRSRGRSLIEVVLAVCFVVFLVGFITVLCIGNYFRAKRAQERQRQRRLAKLAASNNASQSMAASASMSVGGGGGGHHHQHPQHPHPQQQQQQQPHPGQMYATDNNYSASYEAPAQVGGGVQA
mmetsp:Transcript_21899/g.51644  ORF Transcript_21899/g.51644 Transcript_21899/m.51644 type:complete len:125 (-) Transcript_21899:361-735(-)